MPLPPLYSGVLNHNSYLITRNSNLLPPNSYLLTLNTYLSLDFIYVYLLSDMLLRPIPYSLTTSYALIWYNACHDSRPLSRRGLYSPL